MFEEMMERSQQDAVRYLFHMQDCGCANGTDDTAI